MALAFFAGPAPAGEPAVAAAVKATYLVKFAHYVTWPAAAVNGPDAPLILCIVGRDPFGSAIDRAAQGDHVDRHPLVVRRVPMIDRGSGCHIAFIAGPVAEQAVRLIDGSPVLSVTDAEETRTSGIVHFELRAGHVGFDLDDLAAQRGGLTINSRLLAIALTVRSRGRRS
ncbi:MAG: YfiR family protein [Sphingomonas sp.]